MPTVIAHALIGAGLFRAVRGPGDAGRLGPAVAAALAVLPDADVAWRAWTEYERPFGHRGMTHSLAFAVAAGAVAAWALRRRIARPEGGLFLAVTFAACTATHGLFDAMTLGGRGVGFLLPFDATRTFFGVRPIPAAPFSPDPRNPYLWNALRAELVYLGPLVFLLWTAHVRVHPAWRIAAALVLAVTWGAALAE